MPEISTRASSVVDLEMHCVWLRAAGPSGAGRNGNQTVHLSAHLQVVSGPGIRIDEEQFVVLVQPGVHKHVERVVHI